MEFVDEELEPSDELRQITNRIIGAAIEVHKALGPGHSESIYENALAIEFEVRGIPFAKQAPIEVTYRGRVVGESRMDFVVENCVIVELKAIDALAPIHTAQVISYLRASGMRLALLINFNTRKLIDGVKRVAF